MKRNSFYTAAVLFVLLAITAPVKSQVAINTDGAVPNSSAMLDVTSTSRGILIPRVTQAQRNSISSPSNGLIVFQTDGTKGIYFYDGSLGTWTFQGSSTSSWDVDANGLNFQAGNIGIGGESDATASLYVFGYPSINNYISTFENGRNSASAFGIKIKAGATTGFSTSTRFIGFFRDMSTISGAISYDGSASITLANLSDSRLKTNIKETHYSINDLLKIKVRDFTWKESNKPATGFVAQELIEVVPDAVSVPENPNEFWMVSQTTLIPLLVKSIQDQQNTIKQQEDRIKSLEERLSAIESKLNK